MTTTNSALSPRMPANLIYDTANSIQGDDANHSLVMAAPHLLQIDNPPSGTTLQVQIKIHADAPWINQGSAITNATGNSIVDLSVLHPNFAQIVRTGGTGNVKAWGQRMPASL